MLKKTEHCMFQEKKKTIITMHKFQNVSQRICFVQLHSAVIVLVRRMRKEEGNNAFMIAQSCHNYLLK